NMLALNALGPSVGRMLGVRRFVLTYFAAGLGPGLLVLLLANTHLISSAMFVVGASGAIMGVLGAEAAIMLRAWRANRSMAARQRLSWIIFLLVLESVFDLAVLSAGSLFLHLSGTLFGFVVASLSKHRASRLTMAAAS